MFRLPMVRDAAARIEAILSEESDRVTTCRAYSLADEQE
jgi:hypothetical protein